MSKNIKNFVNAVEARAKDRNGSVQYAYVAGYYESMLSHLAMDFPEVAKALEDRVALIAELEARKEAA